MPDGFDVDPDSLNKHSKDLHDFAEQIRGARATAGDTTRAFGLIGVTWSWALNNWYHDANGFADSAANAADRVGDELANMAREYEQANQTATSNMQQITGDLS
ncbi:type VII secretion target [Actinophytocola sp.]|uniref:type VII secretion target n=1 Tax=Actinophytocola sp. TaxID=1872138 RepID=UPI002ED07724